MGSKMRAAQGQSIEEAARVFADPSAYADEPRFYQACALLRREAPVPYVEVDGYLPFWALTRYDDVLRVEREPQLWINAPRPALGPAKEGSKIEDSPVRTLVQMDAPEHTAYRRVSADWFKRTSIARLADRAAELAKRSVDHMAELGGECDFFVDVAVNYPLYIILSLLGLPEEDFPLMLKLTQEMFGNVDDDLAREGDDDSLLSALLEFFEYFQRLVEDRRASPRDDLASVIANATIDGEPIGILEAVGYFVIIATAGHDTTSSAIGGGFAALVAHPAQLELLQDDRALVASAAEEMFRFVSPVKQFMRTATTEQRFGDVTVPEGGAVLLSFASANRDEAVFDCPDDFDVARAPNRHLGFGFGSHYCLGTHLARLETQAFFNELLPRLDHAELTAAPEFMSTVFVGGPKRIPVRYRLR
jgi:cytochrome P450